MMKSELITNAINNNIPIKLFTATPMSQRLKNYYGLVFDIVEPERHARNTGKIVQFRGITGRRGRHNGTGINVDLFEKYNKYIRSKLDEDVINKSHIISFKDSKELWLSKDYEIFEKDGKEIHFMNNAGLDFMKGKDIIIVGKFDKPDEYYLDLWADIGDGSTPVKKMQKIYHNGVWQNLFL